MKIKCPTIYATTNYAQFKRFDSNREINKHHLKRLVESIRARNLLYLFPIVVNGSMEIIDGQHRLAAAMELKVPIFYLVDNNVNKADIAMVNNNRKSWGSRQFINFYYKEGIKEYDSLTYLLNKYPLTIMGAARLIKKNANSYYDGGGELARNIKLGKLNDGDFEIAKQVCYVAEKINKYMEYSFRPDFVLEIKAAMVRSGLGKIICAEKLIDKRHLFPKQSHYGDYSVTTIVRNILHVEKTGHSTEEVRKIMEKHNVMT